jgi:Putative transposase
MNQSIMYSLIMKVSWMTIKQIGKSQGFIPGMTSVLHTFGSDLKYHIHVHSLVSYGGLTKELEWKYPQTKNKLEKYRKICLIYRTIFIQELEKVKVQLTYHNDIGDLLSSVKNTRWVVHSTHPTMDTKIIENYLARYINRIAISPSRLNYISSANEVHIQYNDYKNKQDSQAAPKLIKVLHPLDAIEQILQHNIPTYFQKSRSYGLHNKCSLLQQQIPITIQRNGQTIRTIMEIITQLMKLEKLKCIKCGGSEFVISDIKPIRYLYKNILLGVSTSSPPYLSKTYNSNYNQVNFIYNYIALDIKQKNYSFQL